MSTALNGPQIGNAPYSVEYWRRAGYTDHTMQLRVESPRKISNVVTETIPSPTLGENSIDPSYGASQPSTPSTATSTVSRTTNGTTPSSVFQDRGKGRSLYNPIESVYGYSRENEGVEKPHSDSTSTSDDVDQGLADWGWKGFASRGKEKKKETYSEGTPLSPKSSIPASGSAASPMWAPKSNYTGEETSPPPSSSIRSLVPSSAASTAWPMMNSDSSPEDTVHSYNDTASREPAPVNPDLSYLIEPSDPMPSPYGTVTNPRTDTYSRYIWSRNPYTERQSASSVSPSRSSSGPAEIIPNGVAGQTVSELSDGSVHIVGPVSNESGSESTESARSAESMFDFIFESKDQNPSRFDLSFTGGARTGGVTEASEGGTSSGQGKRRRSSLLSLNLRGGWEKSRGGSGPRFVSPWLQYQSGSDPAGPTDQSRTG